MWAHVDDRELVLLLDGDLPARRRSRLTRHLLACAACRRRADRFRSTLAHLTAIDGDETSGSRNYARVRLECALREAAASAPGSSWAGWAQAVESVSLRTVGAGALVLVLGAILLAVRPPASPGDTRAAWGVLPKASLTPGAVAPLTAAELCDGARPSRLVAEAVRRQVLRAYGVEGASTPDYELDALITPELGGSTDSANLWPQHYQSPVWNARVKDELERLLPALVCSGRMTLADAQREIAADWIAAYKRHFKTDAPLRAHVNSLRVEDDDDLVVVNAEAGPRQMASIGLLGR